MSTGWTVKGAVVNNSGHSGIISKEENKAAGYLNTHTSLSENSEVINFIAQKAEARRIRVPGQPGDKSKKHTWEIRCGASCPSAGDAEAGGLPRVQG